MFPHRSLLVLPLGLALAAVATAQVPPVASAAPRGAAVNDDGVQDVALSDQLLGAPIQSESGDALGTVEDVLVDSGTGRMLAVAVAPAASVRADGALTAVPTEALAGGRAADALAARRTLHVRRDFVAHLADAPSFAREHWSEALDPAWVAKLRAHFGVTSPDATPPAPERLSALLGSTVVDSGQAAVGRVNALAVDLGRREVSAAIVSPVEDLGSRDRLLPVPFSALRAAPSPSPTVAGRPGARGAADPAGDGHPSFAMGLTLDRLLLAPRFDRGDLPRLRALLAAKDLRAFYATGSSDRRTASDPPQRAGGKDRPAGGAHPERPATAPGPARGGSSPR